MKKRILFFLFVAISFVTYAQNDTSFNKVKMNSFFLELGGNAGFAIFPPYTAISLNYERFIFHKRNTFATTRIGTNLPIGLLSHSHYIPIMINLLVGNVLGKKSLFFEIGGGYDFLFGRDGNKSALTSFTGLRYQGVEDNVFFRIGWTPFIGIGKMMKDFRGTTFFGISLGYTF